MLKQSEKLKSITDDMKIIIGNIKCGILTVEQIKSTLEVMVKECEEIIEYECASKCPELDDNGENHCVFSQRSIENKKEYGKDLCPCGNTEVLKLI